MREPGGGEEGRMSSNEMVFNGFKLDIRLSDKNKHRTEGEAGWEGKGGGVYRKGVTESWRLTARRLSSHSAHWESNAKNAARSNLGSAFNLIEWAAPGETNFNWCRRQRRRHLKGPWSAPCLCHCHCLHYLCHCQCSSPTAASACCTFYYKSHN